MPWQKIEEYFRQNCEFAFTIISQVDYYFIFIYCHYNVLCFLTKVFLYVLLGNRTTEGVLHKIVLDLSKNTVEKIHVIANFKK